MKDPQGNSTREAWILCLILGIIMINFPFIHIFSSEHLIFGIPALVLYFFIGWPVSILVTWFFARLLDSESQSSHDETERER